MLCCDGQRRRKINYSKARLNSTNDGTVHRPTNCPFDNTERLLPRDPWAADRGTVNVKFRKAALSVASVKPGFQRQVVEKQTTVGGLLSFSSIPLVLVHPPRHLFPNLVTTDHDSARRCHFEHPRHPASEQACHSLLFPDMVDETRHHLLFWSSRC